MMSPALMVKYEEHACTHLCIGSCEQWLLMLVVGKLRYTQGNQSRLAKGYVREGIFLLPSLRLYYAV